MPRKPSSVIKKDKSVAIVTVSPKYQIVIPKEIREYLKIRPGQRLIVFPYSGRIELVPDRPISESRGIAKGIDTTVKRERS